MACFNYAKGEGHCEPCFAGNVQPLSKVLANHRGEEGRVPPMLEHQTSLGAPANKSLNYSEIHLIVLTLDTSVPYINVVCLTANSRPSKNRFSPA